MAPLEIVGDPWIENGACCVQLRLPQVDGSNVEPIARVTAERLASAADDQVAQLLADAIAAETAQLVAPSTPDLVTRVARFLDSALALDLASPSPAAATAG